LAVVIVVERFDAEAVSRQEQALASLVPNGEGEHAPQVSNKPVAFLLVKVHNHF
jgi:hypothetical protein